MIFSFAGIDLPLTIDLMFDPRRGGFFHQCVSRSEVERLAGRYPDPLADEIQREFDTPLGHLIHACTMLTPCGARRCVFAPGSNSTVKQSQQSQKMGG